MLTFRGKNSSYFCKVVYFGYVMDLCFRTNLQEWKGVKVKKHFGISLNCVCYISLSELFKPDNQKAEQINLFIDQGTWKLFFHPFKPKLYQLSAEKFMNPYLSVSSLQFGLFSPAESCFTPESCRLLLLRSNSVRLQDWELRTEDRAAQLLFERLQSLSLKRQ